MTRFASAGSSGPSQRQLRVGELVRKEISTLLARGDLPDPGLDGPVITVSEVRMSPDLKNAAVYVTVFGDEAAGARIADLMQRNRKWFRGRVGRQLTMKFTPDLTFRADSRFDDDARVDALLRSPEVRRDLDGPGDGQETAES